MTFYIWTYVDSGNIITTITDAPKGRGNPVSISCPITVEVEYQTSKGAQTRDIYIPIGHFSAEETGTRALYIKSASGIPAVCDGNDIIYDYPNSEGGTVYVQMRYDGNVLFFSLKDDETWG